MLPCEVLGEREKVMIIFSYVRRRRAELSSTVGLFFKSTEVQNKTAIRGFNLY